MRGRGRHALHPAGVPVHLRLPLGGERAAGGCGRGRVAGARSLHRVPSHADVLPSSLRKRRKHRIHSGWQRKRPQITRATLTPMP